MGEILSQSEIDELLNQLTSGGTDNIVVTPATKEKEAKNYNFARPSKFNKEQLRTLEIIFDNYARMVSSFLTGYLRTTCTLEVANAEQLTYKEFNNSLVNPVILSLVDLPPLKGSALLEMSANIGYSIIDRVLGGTGVTIKKMRDFSEIEKILLDRIIVQMLTYMVEPWENVIRFKPRLEKIETNSQFAQVISPNEMIALVTLSIKIGSSEGLLNFCLPHLVLEPIMDRLNTKFWFSHGDEEDSESYKEDLEAQLEKVNVPVSVVLGKTNIMVSEFIQLQVGDIIPLDSYITQDLNVMIGNLLKFQAKPGVSRGKNAILITQFLDKED